MVSLRFSFSSLAVLAVVLLSTTLVVGIAQEDELMSSSSNNNLTSSEEEFAGDDDIVDLDVTNSNNSTETEEEFDVTETALDVDIFEEDLAVVGNSTIREDIGVDEEILDEEAPTFEEDISNITMAPTEAPTSTVVPPQQQAATPTTTSAAPVSAADYAEPGSTAPVMVISGATAKISSSLIVGVIVSVAAVAASMIL